MALAKVLYDEAEDEMKRGRVDSDRDNEAFQVVSLLNTLPPDVTISLIQGTLAYDLLRNESTKDFYDQFMQPDDHPGIFMRILARSDASLLDTGDDDRGLWLSSAQVERILDAFEAYLLNISMGNDIDLNYTQEVALLEWTDTPEKKEQAKEWCESMRLIYCDTVKAMKHSDLHRRCPTEVAFSESLTAPASNPGQAAPITHISSFLNIFALFSKSHGGFEFGAPSTALLFPIWEKDDQLARIAEILGSRLTGSEIRFGGYNAANAGDLTITLHQHDSTFPNAANTSWERATDNMYGRIEYTGAPEASEAKALAYHRQWEAKKLEDAENEYQSAISTLKASASRYQIALAGQSDWMKNLRNSLDSDARVDEDFKRRIRAQYRSTEGSTYRPGPAVTIQALSEEETAEVEKKLADFNLDIDKKLEALMSGQAARWGDEDDDV
ncbi:MAG: hypothetical protein Q9184_002291 [Pyrenodesmia sp. 2 TL-2023]